MSNWFKKKESQTPFPTYFYPKSLSLSIYCLSTSIKHLESLLILSDPNICQDKGQTSYEAMLKQTILTFYRQGVYEYNMINGFAFFISYLLAKLGSNSG